MNLKRMLYGAVFALLLGTIVGYIDVPIKYVTMVVVLIIVISMLFTAGMIYGIYESKKHYMKYYSKIDLCDTCVQEQPVCLGFIIEFGDGKGNDNVVHCDAYRSKT